MEWTVGATRPCVMMGVLSPNSMIVLNAGAIIDVDLLIKEVKDLKVDPRRVFVHPHAAVSTPIVGKWKVTNLVPSPRTVVWPALGAAFVMQIRRWWSITFLVCP
jgi:hypothetical protein